MKKLLFVAAATALALSSCSDNEIFTSVEKSKTPITLSVYSQAETRAASVTNLTTLQSGFKFVALNGTSELINSTVSLVDGKWSYGDAEYWPSNVSSPIKFFGLYSPTATDAIDAANDKATVTVDGNSDIVVAYQSQALENTTGGTVNLAFSHILAEVVVSAKGDNNAFTYSVTGITFTAPNKLDYKYSTAVATAATGATNTTYTFLNTATAAPYSATAYTALADANMLMLPALNTIQMQINYTVTRGTDSQDFEKIATVPLAAGKLNRINVTLPSSRTEMTFNVQEVPGWTDTNNVNDPTLTNL